MSANLRKVMLWVGATMLVVLGILHLAVTPIISGLIERNVPPGVAEWLIPPMLLNHAVAGILLLPLGFLTFYAAPSAALGGRWATVVTRTTCIAVAMMPVTLFFLKSHKGHPWKSF